MVPNGSIQCAVLGPLGKTDAAALLRHFGYGVPTFERAAASAENHLALVAQSEIQPYTSSGGRSFKDCHYYDLPWPAAVLELLGDNEVKLKITLLYFVEPNPGALSLGRCGRICSCRRRGRRPNGRSLGYGRSVAGRH